MIFSIIPVDVIHGLAEDVGVLSFEVPILGGYLLPALPLPGG